MEEVTINGYLLIEKIAIYGSNTQPIACALEYELHTHLITNIYLLQLFRVVSFP